MLWAPDIVTRTGDDEITGNKRFVNVNPFQFIGMGSLGRIQLYRGSTAQVGLDVVSDGTNLFHRLASTDGTRWLLMNQNQSGGSAIGCLIGPYTSQTEVTASLVVNSRSAATRVLVARAAASQTLDIFRVEDSAKAALLRVNASGQLHHTQAEQLASFTVATLPSAATAGQIVYASNGRVGVELAGAGTGCLVYSKGGIWLKGYDNLQVQA